MNNINQLAWEIYCFETIGDLDTANFWDDLSDITKTTYITRAELLSVEPKNLTIKQVIVLRKDLNMRKGKMVAQGAHASMAAVIEKRMDGGVIIVNDEYVKQWFAGKFTKVCVSVDSEDELMDVYRHADNKNMMCSLITDAGLTEFNGVPTKTAVAVGPAPSWMVDTITGKLKLL